MATCVVSGSASGIGAGTRERLESDGHRVIGIDLRDAEVEADLSVPEGRAEAIRATLEQCEGRIDRLVLSAGVGEMVPIHLVTSVNYFGSIVLLDAFQAALSQGENSAVVALCSNSARMAPFEDSPYVKALLDHNESEALRIVEEKQNTFLAYAGGKFALGVAIRRRAMEWGKLGIRLNAIAPGPTDTPLLESIADDPIRSKGLSSLPNPLGRHASPAEIAKSIAFLLGPEAGYVHGVILYADAGIDAALFPDRF